MTNNIKGFDNFFEPLENTTPYFKLGSQGEAGSGKTYTTALIAIGLHQRIKSEKPIAIFDTEKSAKFLKPLFKQHGIEAVVKTSRTLSDLVKTMQFCSQGGSDILMLDSITHVYEDFLKDYKKNKKNGGTFIRFEDWGIIKPLWKEKFSEPLVNAEYHILFTGRQGYTYENQEDENGRKELIKTGVKMKAENETAYEPDVLLMMETKQSVLGDKDKEVWREGTVLKDRSTLIDGKTFKNPSYKDIEPVIDILFSDVHEKTETESAPNSDLFTDDNGVDLSQVSQEKRIYIERLNDWLEATAPGTSAEARTMRVGIKDYVYNGETSETAISKLSLEQLIDAHQRLTKFCKYIKGVMNLEAIHVNPKELQNVRLQRLEVSNLGESTPSKLEEYAEYLKTLKQAG